MKRKASDIVEQAQGYYISGNYNRIRPDEGWVAGGRCWFKFRIDGDYGVSDTCWVINVHPDHEFETDLA